MKFDALKANLEQIKEIVRELHVFTNQLQVMQNLEKNSKVAINVKEKRLLNNSIIALTNQLQILNNSIPQLLSGEGFYKKLAAGSSGGSVAIPEKKSKLINIKYKPAPEQEKISLTITDKDRQTFVQNLSQSQLSIKQLKKKYGVDRPVSVFGKPSVYAKISNRFFRNLSTKLVAKGYFIKLNKSLRRMNSPFVLGTYLSMIFFTMLISLIMGVFLFMILLFFNISLIFPFFNIINESVALRFVKFFWIIFAFPLCTGIIMYFYPSSEGKNLGEKIDQELPFVAIHMSAIATSGIEPLNIFKIILKNEEYKYTKTEFKKLINLINFYGQDLVTALKRTARSSSSAKLKALLEGLATAITSGGDLHDFLDKHAEGLLFDYKLERERYTKTSETFMDIYISIAIAAPMILLMLFVIMGSTGALSSFLGLSVEMLSFLIILIIILMNIGFLIFLKLKQPLL